MILQEVINGSRGMEFRVYGYVGETPLKMELGWKRDLNTSLFRTIFGSLWPNKSPKEELCQLNSFYLLWSELMSDIWNHSTDRLLWQFHCLVSPTADHAVIVHYQVSDQ